MLEDTLWVPLVESALNRWVARASKYQGQDKHGGMAPKGRVSIKSAVVAVEPRLLTCNVNTMAGYADSDMLQHSAPNYRHAQHHSSISV